MHDIANQSISGYLNLKTSSSAFATQTGISVPPPIGRMERVSPTNESKLHFPSSPVFQPNYSNQKPLHLQNIVQFCHTKNIPFQNEERMFYRLNKQKQIHKRYKNTLNHCFETNRPLQIDSGVQALKMDLKNAQSFITANLTEKYQDKRKIYLPSMMSDAIELKQRK